MGIEEKSEITKRKEGQLTENRNSEVLELALKYLEKGFSVFPIKRIIGDDKESKKPAITWKKFQTQMPSEEEVREWFSPDNPEMNIAIVTGKISNIVAIDFDSEESIEWGRRNGFFETLVVKTSKGYHCLFLYPEQGIHNFQGGTGALKDIDIRGEGGYIVAPPSLHGSGITYKWEAAKDKKIAALPEIIFKMRDEENEIEKKLPQKTISTKNNNQEDKPDIFKVAKLLDIEIDGNNNARCIRPENHKNGDQNPSMSFDPKTNSFKCFGCNGVQGDVYRLVEMVLGCDFPEAKAFAHGKELSIKKVGQINQTQLGNAERLVGLYGEDIRYCVPVKKWLVWNKSNGAWEYDNTKKIERCAIDAIRNIFREAANAKDSGDQKELAKWALKSETAIGIQSMLAIAKAHENIAISPDMLDSDPWLFNCCNGIIDLRTGKLWPHDKDKLMTLVSPVEYNPDALCPVWDKYLYETLGGNQDLIDYIYRFAGHCLSGDTSEGVFFFIHGTSKTGKSTFVTALTNIWGNYGQTADFESFLARTQGNTVNNDIARMMGKRIVFAGEGPQDRSLNQSLLKNLTGNDVIAARFLYGEFFEFLPQFKPVLISNFKPKITAEDQAVWERIHLVPFDIVRPIEKRDLELKLKIEKEYPGILNKMVLGCLEWQKTGLRPPEAVRLANEAYRSEMDSVKGFLDENCVLIQNAKTRSSKLYEKYHSYENNNENEEEDDPIPF
jgi:putative DNA primase/helicase